MKSRRCQKQGQNSEYNFSETVISEQRETLQRSIPLPPKKERTKEGKLVISSTRLKQTNKNKTKRNLNLDEGF